MPDDLLERIKEFRSEIDRRKQEKAKLEGQYDSGMGRLKDEFGLPDIDAAEDELKKLDGQLAEKDAEIEDLSGQLDEVMEGADGEG